MVVAPPRRWLWIVALLAWLVSLPAVAAPPEIPPAPSEWVTDRAGVMSAAVQQSLNRRLAAYEDRSGHQIIVWIDRSSGGLPIETFAVEAFEQWKLGRAKLDDGLGIFVMVDDRVMRVEVGYGLEPTVTDLAASQVIRNVMIPAIQRNEWDAAIVGGVEALVDTIEGQPGSLPGDPQGEVVEQPEDPRARVAKIVVISVLAIGFLILLIVNPR
ncbi:MAG TPA: TPM domain-containing protein, partial [Enhygromyxa sp.]|nr:TPM domain-containing protein [Enhygromyxa sp.]